MGPSRHFNEQTAGYHLPPWEPGSRMPEAPRAVTYDRKVTSRGSPVKNAAVVADAASCIYPSWQQPGSRAVVPKLSTGKTPQYRGAHSEEVDQSSDAFETNRCRARTAAARDQQNAKPACAMAVVRCGAVPPDIRIPLIRRNSNMPLRSTLALPSL